ncbi:ABC-type bacteriocin/lantibiotic exporter, contains an N-terminal double-glycine peptidase domain [Stigmatella aurantiaca]|uniref:ABC-type bacteriocin/lantibiotic exporter, contains an N-terminal double-glycine peptidase domain n=1 Tax=Stigmatella aurantiaca TaxID=41 RepID=A0A1H7Z9X7_STIAU|nr:ABC transporter ATP-binding protein [Stigmatella aurantiaca]SEM54317.1 ABC-type bacteriocin/lantibiotic exporter, contains an N-terminal double-glycine peptidase domain [Stigmatella aurantiaca]
MKALLRYLRTGYGAYWAILLGLIAFVSLFSFVIPSTFKVVVDSLLPWGSTRQFHLFCLFVLLLVFTRTVLNALQDYLFLRLRQLIEKGLLKRYFESVITLPITRLSALGEGELVNRISLILTNFQMLLPEFVYYCAYALCVSLAVMGVLYLVNPVFLLISLGFLLLHALNFALHHTASRRFSTAYVTTKGQLASAYVDIFKGRKLITLTGTEQTILQSLEQDNRAIHQAAFRRDLAESGQALGQQMLHGATYLALVSLGALAMFEGRLTAGDLALSLLLVGFAYEPVYRLSRLSKALAEADAQFARVLPVLAESSRRARETVSPGRLERLELRGVTFERAGRELLRSVDFEFLPGHVYVIQGPSGGGKTTLFHLLAGLVRPTQGQVLWNGRDVSTLSPAELSQWMTYCPQQSLLLDGTVEENITLFGSTSNQARLVEALHRSTASLFVREDQAASWKVENEGTNFSGGQKQRLHLARAWYHAAPVMLFDEPTASLDTDTEELFFQRLSEAAADRILLIISHRPGAHRHASQVLRLAQGTLRRLE